MSAPKDDRDEIRDNGAAKYIQTHFQNQELLPAFVDFPSGFP
jgi:hypothetical protein